MVDRRSVITKACSSGWRRLGVVRWHPIRTLVDPRKKGRAACRFWRCGFVQRRGSNLIINSASSLGRVRIANWQCARWTQRCGTLLLDRLQRQHSDGARAQTGILTIRTVCTALAGLTSRRLQAPCMPKAFARYQECRGYRWLNIRRIPWF